MLGTWCFPLLSSPRVVKCPGVKRRLFNLLSAVSLVLFAIAITMWTRSYYSRDDHFYLVRKTSAYYVRSFCGKVSIYREEGTPGGPQPPVYRAYAESVAPERLPLRNV